MTTHFNNTIERINCPFDFTRTGRVGLNYAGMLAAAMGARLTIFYVEPAVWPEEYQLYEDTNDNTKGIRRLLKLEATEMKDRFGIETEYIIEPAAYPMGASVGAMSTDYDLIVMGTNGADDLYHHVFAKNTHHVLGLTKCPVLMIPLGYQLHIPKQIVYAFDSETDPALMEVELQRLAKPLDAFVHNLRVEGQDPLPSVRKMELLGEVLGIKEPEEFNWQFEPTYSDEAVAAVDQFVKESGTDILALSYHHRELFDKLFKENVLKKASRIADYPMLVFWH